MIFLACLNDASLCSFDSSLFCQQMTEVFPKAYIIVIVP